MIKPFAIVLTVLFIAVIALVLAHPSILQDAADSFIRTSDKTTALMTYWANGRQVASPSITSGAESIDFAAVIPTSTNYDQAGLIGNDGQSGESHLLFHPPDDNLLRQCEDNFKLCTERAHSAYGVFISVSEIYFAFDDASAEQFYLGHKSSYQPGFVTGEYPLYLVGASAAGLGQFAATCQNGTYPAELNEGLPC